ncbi:MAG: hypothetical protein HRT71_22040 [Flavobacteriales bacterium]|nr:hypothetical protein [Flavobacteriales bacterium]
MSNKKEWGKTRLLGKTKYILSYGILAWGIPSVLAFLLLIGFSNQDAIFSFSAYFSDSFITKLITIVLTFSFVGYFLSQWTWIINERNFSKDTEAV